MKAFGRAGSPALGWDLSPWSRQPACTCGEQGPQPRWPGAPRQHRELLWPPDPRQRVGHLSVNVPSQRRRKLREMDGGGLRCKQGGWLLTVTGLGLGIRTPQLCLRFFGSLAGYLAKRRDGLYPAQELSTLKAPLSCS